MTLVDFRRLLNKLPIAFYSMKNLFITEVPLQKKKEIFTTQDEEETWSKHP